MKTKQLLVLLLALTLVCMSFVACNNEQPNPSQGGDNNDETKSPDDSGLGYDYLPEKDLGYNWRLLMIDDEAETIFETEEDLAESGSAVSYAYFERDMWMIERYNITMESIPAGPGSINTFILNNCLAGDDLYDIGVLHTSENMSGVISNNLTYDIKTLPYVDLTMPYYNKKANDEYTIMGKQVMMNGDYPCCGGGFSMMLFNKNMMADLGLEYPYQIILDGDWTLEVFYQYCENAYRDLDDVGGKTEGDTFGFAGTNIGYFFRSMGGNLIGKDAEGAVIPTICNDYNDQRFAKCIELIDQQWCYFETAPDLTKNMMGTQHWFEGRTLFHFFSRYMTDLIAIEDFDYGLAALPKYDEDQEDYIVPSVGGVTIISSSIRDPESVGYILEAFGQITHELLRPALIEQMREHRILRDSESLEVYKFLQNYMTFTITTNCDPSGILSSNKIVDDALTEHRPSLSAYAKNMESMIKGYYTRFYYGGS